MGIRGHRTAVEVCILCTNFFGAMSGGVLGLAITPIAHDFSVDIELAAWTTLSSMFASAMMGPALGKFADSFGRRRMFWTMYFLQLIAFATCWLSPSFGWLVVGRVVGGISWAGTSPAGFGIMTRGLDAQRRGRIVALQSATGSLGGSIGYAVGGLVVQHVGWRYLFSLPLPVLCCIWLASLLILPPDEAAEAAPRSNDRLGNGGGVSKAPQAESNREKLEQFDWLGTAVFAVFLGFLLLGVNRGNALGWSSKPIVTFLGIAAGVAPFLVLVEFRAKRPILPINLFCERTKVTAMFANNLNWMGYSGSYMLLPIYLQEARGVDVGLVGVVVFVRPLVGSLVSMLLAKANSKRPKAGSIEATEQKWWHSPRKMAQWGAICGPPAYIIYYCMIYETSEEQLVPSLVVALIIQGASCFTMSINCNTIVVSSVPETELANTQAVWRMMQTVFSMVAMAIMLSLAGASGSMSEAASFQPVWAMMLIEQLLVVLLTFSLPNTVAERGGFERVAADEDDEEDEHESNRLLAAGKEGSSADSRSIYAVDKPALLRTGDATPPLKTMRTRGGEVVSSSPKS